jgi:RNA-binding protein YhbY
MLMKGTVLTYCKVKKSLRQEIRDIHYVFLVSEAGINNTLIRSRLKETGFLQIYMFKNDNVALAIFQLVDSVKFSKL